LLYKVRNCILKKPIEGSEWYATKVNFIFRPIFIKKFQNNKHTLRANL